MSPLRTRGSTRVWRAILSGFPITLRGWWCCQVPASAALALSPGGSGRASAAGEARGPQSPPAGFHTRPAGSPLGPVSAQTGLPPRQQPGPAGSLAADVVLASPEWRVRVLLALLGSLLSWVCLLLVACALLAAEDSTRPWHSPYPASGRACTPSWAPPNHAHSSSPGQRTGSCNAGPGRRLLCLCSRGGAGGGR